MAGHEEDKKKKISPFIELGSTGLQRHGGFVEEEFLRELRGLQKTQVYKEMSSNDPVITGVLFAIDMLIRQVDWHVQPASADQADVEAAEFVDECRNDMSTSWVEFLSEVLSFLPFGWSYHELVYKRRIGPGEKDGSRRSKFTDGRIGWRKIPIRAQETLWEWVFDDNGGIVGMVQNPPPDYISRFIPIEKALLFRTTVAKNNPEGKSVIRGAYRPWYFKKKIENIEGIGIERDLAGLPVAKVPPEIMSPQASPGEKQIFAEIKKIVQNIRRDEQEGVVMPAAFDDQNNPLYSLELMSSGGSRQFDTSKIIERYDTRIAMTVLADFILLGHGQVGSFALSSSKTNLFSTALGAWLDMISGIFNRFAIPRLLRLNDFNVEALPTLEHGDIESADLGELGTYVNALSTAGVQLFPDEELEKYLKRQANFPIQEEGE